MPRPKKPEPRTEKVQFRATLAELVEVKAAADRAGLSIADYARQMLQAVIAQSKSATPIGKRRPSRQHTYPLISGPMTRPPD